VLAEGDETGLGISRRFNGLDKRHDLVLLFLVANEFTLTTFNGCVEFTEFVTGCGADLNSLGVNGGRVFLDEVAKRCRAIAHELSPAEK
jgi:hypothetical protein